MSVGISVAVLITCVGCDLESSTEWTGTERDSAGVKLVYNPPTGTWTRATQWVVEKDLSIGVVDGPPEYQFEHVSDVDVGRDGRIYVLDQFAAEIRVFDPQGRYLFSFGRKGEGPGELSSHRLGAQAVLVTFTGDLLVPDRLSNRLNRFTSEGHFIGSVPLSVDDSEPVVSAVYPSGDYVVHRVSRDDRWNGVLRIDPMDGGVLDTLVEFDFQPSPWGWVRPDKQGRTKALMHSPLWSIMPDSGIVLGMSDRSWFEVRGRKGQLEMVVRRHAENPTLSSAEQERFLDSLMDIWERMFRMEDQPEDWIEAEIRRGRTVYIPPERLPAITGFAGGPRGTIWVRGALPVEAMTADILYTRAPVREFWSPNWAVFSRDGVFLGEVKLPPRLAVFRIKDSHIYGVETGEAFDVQRVVRLRIRIPES